MSKADVARYCMVSERTIDRWIDSGKLHCAPGNDGLVFSKSELQIIRTVQEGKDRSKEKPLH